MNSKIREEVGDTEEKGTLAPSGLVPALFTLQGCPLSEELVSLVGAPLQGE